MQNLKTKYIFLFTVISISFCQASETNPKIGLALSGGGAKGFAHIGVLKVLEEIDFPVDYIAGTSMGSIVGALYAIGYSADSIETIALNQDWQELFSNATERRFLPMEEKIWDGKFIGSFPIHKGKIRLPQGLIAGQKIATLLSRLTSPVHYITDFKQLPIPFVCVATDLETGKAVVMDSDYLPDAIRASMAIPTIFTPVKYQNHLLTDGGLIRNLPAEDAKNMGADIVIGVDVGTVLFKADSINSIFDILVQSINFMEAKLREEQYKYCDLLITPDTDDMTILNFNKIETIIERGEIAARQKLPQLKALRDSLNLNAIHRDHFHVPKIDSVYINNISFEGRSQISKRSLMTELNLNYPAMAAISDIEQAIERLYSTQFFERVTYKLEPTEKGMQLVVRVLEKDIDIVRFGLRYNSKTDASMILNMTFRNVAELSSILALDLVVGQNQKLTTDYFIHTGMRQKFGLRIQAGYEKTLKDIYQNKFRIANFSFRKTYADLFLGTIFSNTAMSGFGVQGEYTIIDPRIAPTNLDNEYYKFFTFYGLIWIDTIDRAVFPTKGYWLTFKSEYACNNFKFNQKYIKNYLDWQIYYPLNSKLNLLERIQLGNSPKSNLPLYAQFYLGGTDSFIGMKLDELQGQNVQAFQAGMQYEIFPSQFLIFRWNIGIASNKWKLKYNNNRYESGYGVTYGISTPFGPIELSLMHSNHHQILTHFNIGYKF